MKCAIFTALLSVGVLVGCSHVQDAKRIPASVKDVGVIGPDDEVILYYKEGDYIIVKAFDPDSVSGMTLAQAKIYGQGKVNKVYVESFKQALRNLVSTDRLNVLKPLTPEEVEAYSNDRPNSEQIEAMVIELEKINNFIAVYGAKNANLVRKEELVKSLRSKETRDRIIKKVNAQVEKAVNLIADQTKPTLTKFKSDKDQFLYTVLKYFNANQKFPCGVKGSVDERIKDCSYQLGSEKYGFVLVARSKDFKEVHKELSTGLLWSDRLGEGRDFGMNHYDAEKACRTDLIKVAGAGISGLTWRLPSKEEFEQAQKNGSRVALPVMMNYWFWSSSVVHDDSTQAWLYDGEYGTMRDFDRMYDSHDVRCVAELGVGR